MKEQNLNKNIFLKKLLEVLLSFEHTVFSKILGNSYKPLFKKVLHISTALVLVTSIYI